MEPEDQSPIKEVEKVGKKSFAILRRRCRLKYNSFRQRMMIAAKGYYIMTRSIRIGNLIILAFALPICFAASAEEVSAASAESKSVELVGHLDIEGGGMVDVHDGVAYIGHMKPPFATSIVDVSNPAEPKILSRIKTRPKTHSHKARVCDNIMISNCEQYADSISGYLFNSQFSKDIEVGLAVTDISDPAAPKELAFLKVGGINIANAPAGVHRFEFDCERKLAYISATDEGYRGNIVMIIDLSDPENPAEVSRWWLPGQWVDGGEEPTWRRNDYHVHHPNRLGDRLYVPMWYGGFAIVDVSDVANPKTVTHLEYRRPSPTHTTLPIGHEILGRKWLLVFDEDISDKCEDMQASILLYDITDEEYPSLAGLFRVREGGKYGRCDGRKNKRFGAHQPHERVGEDNLVYAAWFSGGLRIIDISDPYKPKEVGYYVPEPVAGFKFPQSNDVFVDDKGLIYLIDRFNGLDILEFTGKRKNDRQESEEEIPTRRERMLLHKEIENIYTNDMKRMQIDTNYLE